MKDERSSVLYYRCYYHNEKQLMYPRGDGSSWTLWYVPWTDGLQLAPATHLAGSSYGLLKHWRPAKCRADLTNCVVFYAPHDNLSHRSCVYNKVLLNNVHGPRLPPSRNRSCAQLPRPAVESLHQPTPSLKPPVRPNEQSRVPLSLLHTHFSPTYFPLPRGI